MSMKKIWGKRENLKKKRIKAKNMLDRGQISRTEYQYICDLEEQTMNQIVLRKREVVQL